MLVSDYIGVNRMCAYPCGYWNGVVIVISVRQSAPLSVFVENRPFVVIFIVNVGFEKDNITLVNVFPIHIFKAGELPHGVGVNIPCVYAVPGFSDYITLSIRET